MAGDWQQFPEDFKAHFTGWATSDLATEFRAVIRSAAVREIMAQAGKLR